MFKTREIGTFFILLPIAKLCGNTSQIVRKEVGDKTKHELPFVHK